MIYLRKNHWENEKREVEELDRHVKPRIKQPVRKSSVLPNSIAQQNELRYLKKKYAGNFRANLHHFCCTQTNPSATPATKAL